MTSRLAYVPGTDAIVDACRAMVDAAEREIVLQMYLFSHNGDQTFLLPRDGAAPHAAEMVASLVEKKRRDPSVDIVVLLDSNTPSNRRLTRRKGMLAREALREAGIVVLTANLFGARFDPRRRWLPGMNLHVDHGRVAVDDWVEHQNRWQVLHNVEDHRKNLIVDGGRVAAVMSHNFFDPAHDWHENMFVTSGSTGAAIHASAQAAIRAALEIPQPISEEDRAALGRLCSEARPQDPAIDDPTTRVLENEAIRPALLAMFDGATATDELLVATTYFSDLPVLAALSSAAARGVRVRVVVDSIHALPLPPTASWITRNLVNHEVLARASDLQPKLADKLEIRVHDSRAGTMMHLKTAARRGARPMLIGGQANYTPNSFSGAWLETDIETQSPAVVSAFTDHFERLWSLEATRPMERQKGLDRWLREALLAAFAAVGMRP